MWKCRIPKLTPLRLSSKYTFWKPGIPKINHREKQQAEYERPIFPERRRP